jgi:membrane-associated phospholipid phosphatase
MLSLTDFADQAVILPVVVLTAVALVAAGWRRAALAWLCVVPATLLTILAGKLILLGCAGYEPHGWDLHSPSGHTASAALVCGGLSGLMIRTQQRMAIAMLLAAAGASVIGSSRLSLQVHSVSDVIIGGAIGIAGAFVLVWQAGVPPRRLRYLPAIAASLAFCVILFHGRHLRAESWITGAQSIWPVIQCRLAS